MISAYSIFGKTNLESFVKHNSYLYHSFRKPILCSSITSSLYKEIQHIYINLIQREPNMIPDIVNGVYLTLLATT